MPDTHHAPSMAGLGGVAARIRRPAYAVGDIHGRNDLFERMIERLRLDAADLNEKPLVVLLGDYIDRGPDSRAVIERAIALAGEGWCEVEALMGNHEMALLKFLYDPAAAPAWLEHGGRATLASYGLSVAPDEDFTVMRDGLRAVMPRAHLRFLAQLKLHLVVDDYLFVHAGIRPGVPLERQSPDDLLWIRSAFLNSDRAGDHVVVHGHTPAEAPVSKRWRIGLDTGAYATGVLTAARLRDGERLILQVR